MAIAKATELLMVSCTGRKKKDVKNIEGDVRMGALPSELHLGARLEKRKLAKRSDQAPGWDMRRIKGACGRLAS